MVGDEVVARRNDRRLHAAGARDFVKNGSTGTIIDTDLRHQEVVVAFEREGTIRIPNAYLAAGRLEHGYARTSYGVQGATHDVARYHPTDVSSFEEGYVALTRGRQSARIYIVDGNQLDNDNELTHAPAESRPTGIGDIAQALGRRRSTHMAADASNDLGGVAQTLDGATLAQLTARRRHLDGLMQSAPADMSKEIDQAHRTIESIRARKQAWNDVSRTDRVDDSRTGPTRPAPRSSPSTGRTHSHVRASRKPNVNKPSATNGSTRTPTSSPNTNSSDVPNGPARRKSASPPSTRRNPPCATFSAPSPTLQRQRLLWRRAVERTAVYNARHRDLVIPADGGACEQLLGARPADRGAASDYDRAAAAINVAVAASRAIGPHEADLGVAL